MENPHASSDAGVSARARRDVVQRLRQQVVAGAYEPPVEEVVDRLTRFVLARQSARRARPGQ